MDKEIVVETQNREETGKNVSRRLRRSGKVPAVLYRGEAQATPLVVDPKALEAILNSEKGENTLFTLRVGDAKPLPGKFMIKDFQVDPVTDQLLHADFMGIAMDRAIRVEVAIHTVGVAKGVKLQGGILDHPLREVEVECLPGDIPERIEIDISELEMGDSVRVSELKVPPGVKILTDLITPVVSVLAPTVEKVEEAPVEGAPAAEASAEPEVIKKGKAETAEDAEAPAEKKGGGEKGGKPEKR